MRRQASTRSAERTAVVRIERIAADGDGAGEGPVYVPFTLPGETVRVRIAGQRGTPEAVLHPSPARASPPCPHFGACGGCRLQHVRDDEYLAWKSATLEGALRGAGFPAVPFRAPARTPPQARRRMDLALRRTASGIVTGLHRHRGAEVVDLRTCLVVRPELRDLIAPLRDALRPLALLQREGSAIVNLLDAGPDLLLRTDAAPSATDRAALAGFARAHGLPRVSWAKGGGAPEPVCVLRPAITALAGVPVAPPPGAFLQASADGEQAITEAVLAGLPERLTPRSRVIELYAGCGTLTFALAGRARVSAYEGDAAAVGALRRAANQAGLAGRVEATQRDLARQPLASSELADADAVVLDPPHAGAAAQMRGLADRRPERVIYVSCNPAALARDARLLREGGYGLLAATLVDQFLWSARIESVCVFSRDDRRATRPPAQSHRR